MSDNNLRRFQRARSAGRSDIYTLLLVIAAVALAVAIGFLWHRNTTLMDTANPFHIVPQTQTPPASVVGL